jgi:hypothetical protein
MGCWITPDGNYYEGMHVANGSIEVTPRPSDMHDWVDGAWLLNIGAVRFLKIQALNDVYESDRDKLNRAWLSAMIADGADETVRKAAIEAQMSDLDAQLEADILAVIMEE